MGKSASDEEISVSDDCSQGLLIRRAKSGQEDFHGDHTPELRATPSPDGDTNNFFQRNLQSHPSQQKKDTQEYDHVRLDTNNAATKVRRSKRTPKKPKKLLNENLGRGNVIQFEFDEQCGMDQPGRNYFRDEEEKKRMEEEKNGMVIFEDYLKPAGWKRYNCAKLNTDYVFVASGMTKENAIDGETKFHSYEEISKKWKSDTTFQGIYRHQDDEDSDTKNEPEEIFSQEGIGRDSKPSTRLPNSVSGNKTRMDKERKGDDVLKTSQEHSSKKKKKKLSRNKVKKQKRSAEPSKKEVGLSHPGACLCYEQDMEKLDDREEAALSPSSLDNRLGRPTPGVPAVAGRSTTENSEHNIKATSTNCIASGSGPPKRPIVLRLKKGCVPPDFLPKLASPNSSLKKAPTPTNPNKNGSRKRSRSQSSSQETECGQVKRGNPIFDTPDSSSVKQKNKRPKKKVSTSANSTKQKEKTSIMDKWLSSHSQIHTESPPAKQGPVNSGEQESTIPATGSGWNGLLQSQDLPVVTPTHAIQRDHAPAESKIQNVAATLCLSEENNDDIIELKKQRDDAQSRADDNALRLLEANDSIAQLKKELKEAKKKLKDAQDIEQAQQFEIAYLQDENDKLRKEKAKGMVQLSNLQDEIDQMQRNGAME